MGGAPLPAVIVLFTRDLRVADNPTLTAAAAAGEVAPVFVRDRQIGRCPARDDLLDHALADLDDQLRRRDSGLLVRHGDVVDEVCRVAAEVNAAEVHVSADVSGYAQRRQARLAAALRRQRRALSCHDEVVTVVAPGRLLPASGGDHYRVFGPYLRAWLPTTRRPIAPRPRRLPRPEGFDPGPRVAGQAPNAGGERLGRRRARRWIARGLPDYDRRRDDLAADATSHLSSDLHLGCLSARELAGWASDAGGAGFVRQLAWRDFHHQLLAARPDAAVSDYRTRGDQWREDPAALDAWKAGACGVPIVDAGMRQLASAGWLSNRARLIVASFLTKNLYVDWRAGAAHFFANLVDGDVANNSLNWQWVAGTGADTRPNRVLNPLLQARRFDPSGDYTRRWVPELESLETPNVHEPWRLGSGALRRLGYPPPIVDLAESRGRFLRARIGG